MLRLSTPLALGRNEIRRHLTTLSVSWLNGQFKAVAVHRGAVEGTWEHPGDIEGAGQFEGLIREAVTETNYHGQTVSLLLAHPRLVQQLVDLPPVKGPTLQKLIRRQVQQQKLFPGEAAWAWQSSVPAKGGQRVILHLFPKPMLDQLVQGCQRNGLDLISVVPVSAVLHYQLARLPLEKEEVTLLAAETGGTTSVAAGRGDGQLLLVRTLPNTWNASVERLALDLNRTILFLTQQLGEELNEGMWLFGPGAREQAPALQGQMQLPVAVNPVEYQPFYWATEALKLRLARTPNFLSEQMQKAPQRRVYAKVVGAGALLLVLLAMASSAFALWQARQETANLERLRQSAAQLETRRQQLQQRNTDLSHQQQLVNVVLDRRPSPVPVWFLGYLSEVVPPELVVTNLHLKREDNSWRVQMATVWQGATNQPALGEVSNVVARLQAQLFSGPFHLDPVSTSEQAPSARPKVGPNSVSDLLRIEGVIR